MQSSAETARSRNGDRDASQVRPGVSKLAISSVNVGRYRSLGAGTTVGIDYAEAVVEQRRYGTTSGSSPDLDRVGRQCSHHSNLFGHVDAKGHALRSVWGASSPKCDLNLDGTINATDQSTQLGNIGVSSGFAELTRNRNRLGYAGYAADSESAERWHVRNRCVDSRLGRWCSRDPLGYFDGRSILEALRSAPIAKLDPTGTYVVEPPSNGDFVHWYFFGRGEPMTIPPGALRGLAPVRRLLNGVIPLTVSDAVVQGDQVPCDGQSRYFKRSREDLRIPIDLTSDVFALGDGWVTLEWGCEFAKHCRCCADSSWSVLIDFRCIVGIRSGAERFADPIDTGDMVPGEFEIPSIPLPLTIPVPGWRPPATPAGVPYDIRWHEVMPVDFQLSISSCWD